MEPRKQHDGISFVGPRRVSVSRVLGLLALAGALLLSGCGSATDTFDAGGDFPSVTDPVAPAEGPSEDATTSTESPTGNEATSTAGPTADEASSTDDNAWLAEADSICRLAIDNYLSIKAAAGAGAPAETLALGAAAAATGAAKTLSALPEPTSDEALGLQDAVVAWAAAYRDMAVAMDSGSYSEVSAAGDAIEVAADEIRGAGSVASCVQMVDDV